MKGHRRWLAALLAAAVTTAGSLSGSLALPAEVPFAEFRIDASMLDIISQEISVDVYRRDNGGQFILADNRQYPCKLNRSTEDAAFFIQSSASIVWVTVDYLTDINGDGVYELLEDSSKPTWDVMDAQGELIQPDLGAVNTLTSSRPYILSPETLRQRGRRAVQERMAGGPSALELEPAPDQQDATLFMIQLHCASPFEEEPYEQTYYLKLYDRILPPLDVSPDDWFYPAVEFTLERGYFAGSSGGRFLPNQELSRAQLAQVLWTMCGCPEAEGASSFSDVSSDDWFAAAVAWCQQENLMTGVSASCFAPDASLSREQMIAVLYRYARYTGSSLRAGADLSEFSDQDAVSPWAVNSMRWAVSNGLISGSNNTLRPRDIVSRAEMASVLYSYDLNLGLRR